MPQIAKLPSPIPTNGMIDLGEVTEGENRPGSNTNIQDKISLIEKQITDEENQRKSLAKETSDAKKQSEGSKSKK